MRIFCLLGDPVNITSIFSDKEIRYGEALKEVCRAKGLPVPRIKWSTPNRNVSGKNIVLTFVSPLNNCLQCCLL